LAAFLEILSLGLPHLRDKVKKFPAVHFISFLYHIFGTILLLEDRPLPLFSGYQPSR
jgi:hypothetical protein